MKQYHWLIILSAITVSICLTTSSQQATFAQKKNVKRKAPLQLFMQRKLEATQQILEGLVTDDYRLIGKGADQLEAIANAAEWHAANEAGYDEQSKQFLRITKRLRETAKAKNLDAAALTYVELTMNCISCHDHVRGNR